MILLRGIAALAGIGILAAVAHVTIMATGGYSDTNTPITIALACGVAIGAPIAGMGSRGLAVFLIAALIAGELYGFGATASWHVAHLEAQAAPIHDAEAKHKAALERVNRAEHSDAVQRAEAAAAKVQADAMAKSAEKGCATNCRAVLEAQVKAATAAVEDARQSLQHELEAARAAVERAPLPGSANALADRTGIPASALDLIFAGLRSFACTVLAGGLLFFAAHGPRKQKHELAALPETSAPVKLGGNVVAIAPRARLPVKIGDVDAFLLEHVAPEQGARVSWAELFIRYRTWCEAKSCTPGPLTPSELA